MEETVTPECKSFHGASKRQTNSRDLLLVLCLVIASSAFGLSVWNFHKTQKLESESQQCMTSLTKLMEQIQKASAMPGDPERSWVQMTEGEIETFQVWSTEVQIDMVYGIIVNAA